MSTQEDYDLIDGMNGGQHAEKTRRITERETGRLFQWQRRMITLFVGTWAYLLFVIALDVLFEAGPEIVQLALLPALGLVIASVALQFSARCPSCGYRLGRQSRLLVPDRCGSCGVFLRTPRDES